mgnify:FL=1
MTPPARDTLRFESLRIDHPIDGVAELVLIGPGKGNTMGPAFWRELPLAIASIEADDAVRAFVVRGEGAHFSFGLDLNAMVPAFTQVIGSPALGPMRLEAMAEPLQAAFDAIFRCAKPSVAAVSGWCIGGGVELVCACDLRVASADARFALREVKVGMVADLGGIQRLPHIVGEGVAREMALTGDPLDAQQALAARLVNAVHPDPQAAIEAARGLAARIAANSPLVLAGIKQVMNARLHAEVDAAMRAAARLNGSLFQSDDFREAIDAFRDKREPVFRGR